jgi:hypothetical protein
LVSEQKDLAQTQKGPREETDTPFSWAAAYELGDECLMDSDEKHPEPPKNDGLYKS